MSEIVREAGAGLVVDPTPAAIAAGLNTMSMDAARSRAMGEAGRDLVIARYGWPTIAHRMEALYRSVAGGADAGGGSA